jgi:hypothetical protein
MSIQGPEMDQQVGMLAIGINIPYNVMRIAGRGD